MPRRRGVMVSVQTCHPAGPGSILSGIDPGVVVYKWHRWRWLLFHDKAVARLFARKSLMVCGSIVGSGVSTRGVSCLVRKKAC